MWQMYDCVLKFPFRQGIFKHTYRKVVLSDYILTFAIYCTMYIREFKHRWYQKRLIII